MKKSFLRSHKTALASGLVLTGAVLAQGCLQREVNPQKPATSNVFVEQIANSKISEIDLLFVIDNSVSMADKQEILKRAVPKMVERLVNPNCVDADGNNPVANPGDCPAGTSPEFEPVDDIHIGVISSSLGGHGSNNCLAGEANPDSPSGFWDRDDKGHLIPTVRANVVDKGVDGMGFLAWNGGGTTERDALITSFEEHVVGTGETGCGFEAPLEAWYRFLVDPSPPADMVVDPATNRAVSTGVDDVVLAQREAFLRPEGLVAIVLLTDENDCSAMDGGSYYNNAGFGYLIAKTNTNTPGEQFVMPIATASCEANPNDKCCFSCLQAGDPPAGCEAEAGICNPGNAPPKLVLEDDRPNVRCFQNKRRFGVDLLYPTERYVDALTKSEIVDARTSESVSNPLLRGVGANVGTPRDPGLVFFAGIVGIPWQDVATPESLDPANPNTMRYLTASELSQRNVNVAGREVDRWEVILGQPGLSATSKRCQNDDPECGQAPVPPLDPFMVENIGPRDTGLAHPIVPTEVINPPGGPGWNNINGTEANHLALDPTYQATGKNDLQYACIFPLSDEAKAEKVDCEIADGACDCGDETGATDGRNRPLCRATPTSVATTSQYWGKAYPGTRILQVLKDFGANSIVGSICPKVSDESANDFGYNPAVQAIVDRLAEKLTGKCLPRELSVDENTGEVPCSVVEAKPADPAMPLTCDEARGRYAVGDLTRAAVIKQLEDTKRCGPDTNQDCNAYEMCEIGELIDEGRGDCLYNQADESTFVNPGFCYIDPAKQDEEGNYVAGGSAAEQAGFVENPEDGKNPLVANCPATERRLLRFVGADTPVANSITFVACTGDAASKDAPIPGAPSGSGDTGGGMGGAQ